MTKDDSLAALSWAAHNRHITYGQLVVSLSPEEREQICKDYRAELRRREAATKAAIRANRDRRREEAARVEKLDTERAAQLYALGWSDARIAAKLKVAGPWRIRDWRSRTGRPANNIGRPQKKGAEAP